MILPTSQFIFKLVRVKPGNVSESFEFFGHNFKLNLFVFRRLHGFRCVY